MVAWSWTTPFGKGIYGNGSGVGVELAELLSGQRRFFEQQDTEIPKYPGLPRSALSPLVMPCLSLRIWGIF